MISEKKEFLFKQLVSTDDYIDLTSYSVIEPDCF